ncbi:hypothetical protein SUGI_0431390 [Cryptomeria japonica]|nr:hypothetical protein SUGI_0431390 [Cryptomeria japonica]
MESLRKSSAECLKLQKNFSPCPLRRERSSILKTLRVLHACQLALTLRIEKEAPWLQVSCWKIFCRAHSDPNALTILLQGYASGLQVFKNGRWCTVKPVRNAFVVNIGDQLQVLSNGIYKNAIHRAIVNAAEGRISVPTFYCPSPVAMIAPTPSFVTGDNPAQYRKFTYEEFYQKFWTKTLEGNMCLNFYTCDSTNVCLPTQDNNLHDHNTC